MPPESDLIRIRHMVEAGQTALTFAAGRSRSDFVTDRMLVMAIVHAVQVVGEAAFNVSEDTRQLLPDVPWTSIVGMRHRLVHAYFDVDAAVVWSTVREDLEPLVTRLTSWLQAQ